MATMQQALEIGFQNLICMQVMVYDHRGQGLSSDSDPAPLTVQSMAASTVDLIKALGLGRPDVWGESLGGAIALTILTSQPGAVRRVVSQGGFPGGNTTQQVCPGWGSGFRATRPPCMENTCPRRILLGY